jgi:hypothetical protein
MNRLSAICLTRVSQKDGFNVFSCKLCEFFYEYSIKKYFFLFICLFLFLIGFFWCFFCFFFVFFLFFFFYVSKFNYVFYFLQLDNLRLQSRKQTIKKNKKKQKNPIKNKNKQINNNIFLCNIHKKIHIVCMRIIIS